LRTPAQNLRTAELLPWFCAMVADAPDGACEWAERWPAGIRHVVPDLGNGRRRAVPARV